MTTLRAIQADITTLRVDAIVNAANSSLLGGGGVDGAIHRAAGPDLLHECLLLGGCNTGEAKITGGSRLPAKHVIHTVGPVWRGGGHGEADLLAACYSNSLKLCVTHGLASIAFPAISTGVFGYPVQEAARIAVETCRAYPVDALEITFCCFSRGNLDIYQALLAEAPDQFPADRAAGCLLGLAIGDALGTTLEFQTPGSFAHLRDMIGGGPFGLKAGQWTDDTSMALCLAESLIECGGFDLTDQARRYVRWWHHGHLSATGDCFDIGNTVSSALTRFITTGDPASGPASPYSAGNGSIMRLAPVPIRYADPETAIHFATESSRTTHQAPAALDACRYMAGILCGLIRSDTKEEVLAPYYHPSGAAWDPADLDPAIAAIAAGSFKEKQPPEIRGTGYVVHSLEAALWAFHQATDFRHGALLAVNLGEDADTTGAIYGQFAGALHGASGIPSEWLAKLHARDLIHGYALKLYQLRNSP